MSKDFIEEIQNGYSFEGKSIVLGAAIFEKICQSEALVKLPLKTLNRHGLIAGATGSGKTKTLQVLAENLSKENVPVLLMDIKGDLSGIAKVGEGHPKIDERHKRIGIPFSASSCPVEFLTLSDQIGTRLRATVTEFGPILFSKILGLNDTQTGVVTVLFKYCDDKNLPLLDLADFKKALNYITDEIKQEFEEEYGSISARSTGIIIRKIIELEQQGADKFFGERSFDVDDLCRSDEQGRGVVSILRLMDIQNKPKLFSTFMLQMLAEIYAIFPEEGDLEKPKLVIFIDEAHLVFDEASAELLDQIESIIKLIRSKGVGIFFVTQNPDDIPEDVLGQLGLKIQHALRAFTAKDRKAIKLAAENYPISKYYETDTLLTELGIGEALVTALNEKGIPTPLAHTLLRAPESRMDVLCSEEIVDFVSQSNISKKYNEEVNRESAYEILNEKIKLSQAEEHKDEMVSQKQKAAKSKSNKRKEKSTFEKIVNSPTGKIIVKEVTRGILGVLGLSSSKHRKRSLPF